MILYDRQGGRDLKRTLSARAGLLPLFPRVAPETFRMPVVEGPFDGVDDEGVPLIATSAMDVSMDRMGLPTRRTLRLPVEAPSGGPPMPPRPTPASR
jgi:hypothetical protein